MIGVDIVDHSDPLLRKRDERSFRLIRHPQDEHDALDVGEEQLFWLYWVAKEATYKAQRARIRFDPKKIVVRIYALGGAWHFQSQNINGFLKQNAHYTFGICTVDDKVLAEMNYEIFDCSQRDQSASIRRQMIKSLTEKGKTNVQLAVDQKELPAVWYDETFHLATFTHHHYLMAYICE